jgi:hypothetical protein
MQYYITTIVIDGVAVIDDYGTGLGDRGELIETDIEGVLKHNYKVVGDELIALTEAEKLLLIKPPQPSEIENLIAEFSMVMAGMQLEQQQATAEITTVMAMMMGGM